MNFTSASEKSGSVEGLNLATSSTIHHQHTVSSSSGEDSNFCRMDDSPRKRPRKQQFDVSQLTQDKLMVGQSVVITLQAPGYHMGAGENAKWGRDSNVPGILSRPSFETQHNPDRHRNVGFKMEVKADPKQLAETTTTDGAAPWKFANK